jgi:phosphoribosylanthranilate isomerase
MQKRLQDVADKLNDDSQQLFSKMSLVDVKSDRSISEVERLIHQVKQLQMSEDRNDNFIKEILHKCENLESLKVNEEEHNEFAEEIRDRLDNIDKNNRENNIHYT